MGNYTSMAFNPANGLENRTTYETRPASETRTREILSAMPVQLQNYLNATLLPQLETEYSFLRSANAAASLGANGALISSGYPNTIQGVLKQLHENMKDVSQGSVADGSITLEKMAANVLYSQNILLSAALVSALGNTAETALDKLKSARWFGYIWDAYSTESIGGEVINGHVFTATIENNPDGAMASDFTLTIPSGVSKVCVELSGEVGGEGWTSGTLSASRNGTSICTLSQTQTSSFVRKEKAVYVAVTGGDKITLRGSAVAAGGAQNPRLKVQVIA